MSNTRSTSIRRFAVPLSVAAFLAAASPAMALQPVGPGGGEDPPKDLPPVAHLTATPQDAIVSTLLLPTASAHKLVIGGGSEISQYGGGDVVKLDASNSTDDHNEIAKVSWDLDNDGSFETTGTWSKERTESLRFFTVGDHTVRVKVEDTGGFSDIDKVVIHVRNAPHAVISSNLVTPLVGQDVQFDATGSTASPAIADVAWDLDGDGTYETDSGTSLQAHSSYATPGDHRVTVRITDAGGVSRTASVVEHVNQAPTAAFTSSAAVVGQAVSFDGSDSGDDQPIADYAWDLDGDGTFETDSGSSPLTSKTYGATGTVNVRLRVTDSLGATSIVTHPVIVGPAPKTAATGSTAGTTGKGGTAGTGGTATGAAGGTGTTGGAAGSTLSGKVTPVLTFASKKLKLSSTGRVTFKVTCPATATSCKGKLKLRTTAKHPASLGSVSFALKAGQTKNIRILLPAAQRRAVRRAHHLKASAVVTVSDAAGITGVSTVGVLIGL